MGLFKGKVGIKAITSGKNEGLLTLAKNEQGKYSSANAAALAKRVEELEGQGKEFETYSLYAPKGRTGNVPTLLANKWGKPYLAWLEPKETKVKVLADVWFD